jgi:cell division protein FtsL
MPQLINWDLLREPYNWVIVALMVAIFVTALTVFKQEGGTFKPFANPIAP